MIFILLSNGRNFGGIDSHVLRPIITALVIGDTGADTGAATDGGVIVTLLKWDISAGIRHTKSPPAPIPREEAAAATTATTSVMNADGIFSLEMIIVLFLMNQFTKRSVSFCFD